MPVFQSKKLKYLINGLCLITLLGTTACEQAAVITEDVAIKEQEAEQAISSIAPGSDFSQVLRVDNRPWYGDEAVKTSQTKGLPQALTEPNAITMTLTGTETIYDLSRKLQAVTGVPVMITRATYASDSLANIATAPFSVAGGQEVSGGRIVWSGSMPEILDQIANTYSAEWNYVGGIIKLNFENTKTFMLNALANDITLTGEAGTEGTGSANAATINMEGTTTLEIWGEISEAIESIVNDSGKATFSPSTGTITVTSNPDILRRVENYLRYQNQMRLRRVAISVKVLSVTTADAETYGASITSAIQGALGSSLDITLDGTPSDGLSLGILKDNVSGGSLASTLEASNTIERANIVHSGTLITLSDQPAPLQVGRQIAYLERVSSTSGDTSSVSLEPGTVDVGLFMTVLPRIVEGDKILMRLNISITDADPNFRTFGAGDIEIELPEIDTTGFLQNAVVSDGETLVIAGFEKRQNTLSDTKSPLWLLGGGRSTNRTRELLVLVINSKILPEQPLTIIGE